MGFQACVLGVCPEHFDPYMSTDIATAAEFHLTDWWDKNRQRLVRGVMLALVVALGLSFYFWKKNQREVDASCSLSNVQPGLGAAQAYLKVTEQYPGSAAAARALLLAAGGEFADGNYAEAQGLFERFLREAGDSSWRPAALLGVAASLDAQGKKADAILRYQDFVQRYANDSSAAAAKSALAHLYLTQNQLVQAQALYQELARSEQNSSYGLESMVSLQNLLAKHPELAQPKAATTISNPVSNPAKP